MREAKNLSEKNENSPEIFSIAEDLAEGISQQPLPVRNVAAIILLQKHGFSYDFFTNRNHKFIRAVLKKGYVLNEGECRKLLDVVSDTTISSCLREDINKIIQEYENKGR